MINQENLKAASALAQRNRFEESAKVELAKVLEGLRLAHRQTVVRNLREGHEFTRDFKYDEQEIVQVPQGKPIKLLGEVEALWRMCQSLAPELHPWSEWVGTRESGHLASGIKFVIPWPDEKRTQLISSGNSPADKAILRAIADGQLLIKQRVEEILAEAPNICEKQAEAGEWSAAVMHLVPGEDFSFPACSSPSQLKPEWLGPIAAQVFEKLVADKPTFRPAGSGYQIVVSWR